MKNNIYKKNTAHKFVMTKIWNQMYMKIENVNSTDIKSSVHKLGNILILFNLSYILFY
jgi:hypothetical protein